MERSRRERPRVVVVGAGVSGCACAATLAAAGFRVTVLNSALDAVGLPAYGPDLVCEEEGLGRVLATLWSLPAPLKEVWLRAAAVGQPRAAVGQPWLGSERDSGRLATGVRERLTVSFGDGVCGGAELGPEGNRLGPGEEVGGDLGLASHAHSGGRPGLTSDGGPDRDTCPDLATDLGEGLRGVSLGGLFLNVDRRLVSIETKRLLETMSGLEFRQGLVSNLHVEKREGRDCVVLETVFGEVLEAEAVVLAVGLSLGGRVQIGEDRLAGGRYGETPSDGLLEALGRYGVEFNAVTVQVGARLSQDGSVVERLLGLAGAACGSRRGVAPGPAGAQLAARPGERESVEEIEGGKAGGAEGMSGFDSAGGAEACAATGLGNRFGVMELRFVGLTGSTGSAESLSQYRGSDDAVRLASSRGDPEEVTWNRSGGSGAERGRGAPLEPSGSGARPDGAGGGLTNGGLCEWEGADGSALTRTGHGMEHEQWPRDYPPAPHMERTLRLRWGVGRASFRGSAVTQGGWERPAERPSERPSLVDLGAPGLVSRGGSGREMDDRLGVGPSGRQRGADIGPLDCGEDEPAGGEPGRDEPAGGEPKQFDRGGPRLWLTPLVSPDGLATAEVYFTPELLGGDLEGKSDKPARERETRSIRPLDDAGQGDSCNSTTTDAGGETGGKAEPEVGRRSAAGDVANRMGYMVRGRAVRSLGADGRLVARGVPVGPVWVCGRAAGAKDYVESLSSGVRVAKSVIAFLQHQLGCETGGDKIEKRKSVS